MVSALYRNIYTKTTSSPIHLSLPFDILLMSYLFLMQGLKNQSRIKLNIVRCPPVTTVLIRRPDLRYQLGFSVQNGIVGNTVIGFS